MLYAYLIAAKLTFYSQFNIKIHNLIALCTLVISVLVKWKFCALTAQRRMFGSLGLTGLNKELFDKLVRMRNLSPHGTIKMNSIIEFKEKPNKYVRERGIRANAKKWRLSHSIILKSRSLYLLVLYSIIPQYSLKHEPGKNSSCGTCLYANWLFLFL